MLGGIFGGKKSRPDEAQVPKLSSALEGSILSAVGLRNIPPMPGAAHKAFQLAIDPNAEARDFIEVIEADESLSARVIKIANSVYYDRGKPSSNIEESVLVIGINELRGLLNANTLSDIFPCRHPARTQLWANDIATALIAKILAQRLKPSKIATVFLGGLMHDIGKLLILQRTTEDYGRVLTAIETQGIPFCEAEEQIFPFDHTEVGQLIAEKWKFSNELIDTIRNHHRPFSELGVSRGNVPLPALIQAADLFAHALGLGHPKNFNRFRLHAEAHLEEVWALIGVPESEQKPMLTQFKRTFDIEYDLYSGNVGKAT